MKYFREELTIHPLNIILLFFISTSTVVFQADLAINFHETVISFFIISASGIVIYFLIRWIIKDRIKSAILLTSILFITLFFRDIYELLTYSGVTKLVSDYLIFVSELFFAIIIVVLVLAPIIIWLYKSKRKLLKLNSYLNLLTTIFFSN